MTKSRAKVSPAKLKVRQAQELLVFYLTKKTSQSFEYNETLPKRLPPTRRTDIVNKDQFEEDFSAYEVKIKQDRTLDKSTHPWHNRLQKLADVAGNHEIDAGLTGLADLARGKDEEVDDERLIGAITELSEIIDNPAPGNPKAMPSLVNIVLQAINLLVKAYCKIKFDLETDEFLRTTKLVKTLQQLIAVYPQQTSHELTSDARAQLDQSLVKLKQFLLKQFNHEDLLICTPAEAHALLSSLQSIFIPDTLDPKTLEDVISIHRHLIDRLIFLLKLDIHEGDYPKEFTLVDILNIYQFGEKLRGAAEHNESLSSEARSSQEMLTNWLSTRYADCQSKETKLYTLLSAYAEPQQATRLLAADRIDLSEYPVEVFVAVTLKFCDETALGNLSKQIVSFDSKEIAETLNDAEPNSNYLSQLISAITKLLGYDSENAFFKSILLQLPKELQEDFAKTIFAYAKLPNSPHVDNPDGWLREAEANQSPPPEEKSTAKKQKGSHSFSASSSPSYFKSIQAPVSNDAASVAITVRKRKHT